MSLTEAHATLAYVSFYYDRNQNKAEAEFKRAIELNPDYPTAHQWSAEFLYSAKRFEDTAISGLGYVYAISGDTKSIRNWIH